MSDSGSYRNRPSEREFDRNDSRRDYRGGSYRENERYDSRHKTDRYNSRERDLRDPRHATSIRDPRDPREFSKDRRDSRDMRDVRDRGLRDPRDRDPRDRNSRDRDIRDPKDRDVRDPRDRDIRDRDVRDRDGRDPRDRIRGPRDGDVRGPRDRDLRDPRDRDVRDPRERDLRDPRERDIRALRNREVRDKRNSPEKESLKPSYRDRDSQANYRDRDREDVRPPRVVERRGDRPDLRTNRYPERSPDYPDKAHPVEDQRRHVPEPPQKEYSSHNVPPPPPPLSAGIAPHDNPHMIQATKSVRRLYVGNLPSHIRLTDMILSDYFIKYMKHLGFTTPDPVISISLHQDNTYCFIEFRSVADTDAVLALMNGYDMSGRKIKLSRPKDHVPVTNHEILDFIVGYPAGSFKPPGPLTSTVVVPSVVEDPATLLRTIPKVQDSEIDILLPSLIPALGLPTERITKDVVSNCVLIESMTLNASDEMLVDDDKWLDFVDDIRDHATSIVGSIKRVVIPRPLAPISLSEEIDVETGTYIKTGDIGPWFDPDDLNKVFVLMNNNEDALKFKNIINGQFYNDHRITAAVIDSSYLDKYLSKDQKNDLKKDI